MPRRDVHGYYYEISGMSGPSGSCNLGYGYSSSASPISTYAEDNATMFVAACRCLDNSLVEVGNPGGLTDSRTDGNINDATRYARAAGCNVMGMGVRWKFFVK